MNQGPHLRHHQYQLIYGPRCSCKHCWAEQPIALETPTGTINGTLTIPEGNSKPPIALIIAGSGPTDRNGNSPTPAGTNNSLEMLSAALARTGFASVRYDKRGVADSAGTATTENNLRFEDYVLDATAWAQSLARDSRFSGVVIIGHSEGSLIGMLTAQRTPILAFISIAGPAEKGASLLRHQLLGRLPPDLAARNEAILSALETGTLADDVPTPLAALYRPSVQPYLISWFRYTPTIELAKLEIPCLVVHGETDIQVSVSDSQLLHAAQSRCQERLIPGMNHVMKLVPADRARQLASYGDPTLPIADELVHAVTEFLHGVAATRSDGYVERWASQK